MRSEQPMDRGPRQGHRPKRVGVLIEIFPELVLQALQPFGLGLPLHRQDLVDQVLDDVASLLQIYELVQAGRPMALKMQRHQAPEPAVDHHGARSRALAAHAAQVFDVVRGYAPA